VQGKKVGGAVAGTRPTGRQTSHPERPPWRLPGTVAKERPTPIGPARGGARTPHAIRPLARTRRPYDNSRVEQRAQVRAAAFGRKAELARPADTSGP
jgi:hypothetical protein